MATNHSFFYSSDPLKKAEYFFRQENESGSILLGARPVCIVGDLEILYNWTNDAHRRSNWKLKSGDSSLFRHYKEILISDNKQSVMIEQNKIPCMQFDILPAPTGALSSGIKYDKSDYILHFLFRESFRDPELFVRSLKFLIECLTNLSGIRFLYLALLEPDKFIDSQLTAAGFDQVDGFPLFEIKAPVYRLLIREH